MEQESSDIMLIQQSLAGDRSALELLVKRHQDWIYNVALNFMGDPEEAADLTQEVLIKVITKLASFRQESAFRTWLYRIVKNHFLNTKRGTSEERELTFERFGQGLDQLPDQALGTYQVEQKLLVKEAKISCMKGMLLCLDREQRMIFILGELFEYPDTVGSEIMEISRQNFRVKLHRAKKQLYNFMDDKCGLIRKANPCRCARKTTGFIKMGFVDPVKLYFQRDVIAEIHEVIDQKLKDFSETIIPDYQQLYQEHPFVSSPEKVQSVKKLLSSTIVRETFNLDSEGVRSEE